MITAIDIKEANSYSEVLGILKVIAKTDYEKVPKSIINVFEKFANKDYIFKYNFSKDFSEQDLSKDAKVILAILFRDYWANEKQREIIIAKQIKNRKKIEEEKKEKYNIDVFQKINSLKEERQQEQQIQIIEENKLKDEISMIEHKESLFNRLIKKIKLFFQKIQNI